MNCIIPFTSKVKFNYPVKEICSISLEHEITKNDDELLGNFFITGTCKEHELSVNTNDFNFTLPFSVSYTNKINPDTLEFNIDNFTYELEDNELKVNIDYNIQAEDIPELREEELDPYDLITEELPRQEEAREELVVPEEKLENTSYPNVITSMEMDNDYQTYHVCFMKGDSIENICSTYKVTQDELLEINNLTSFEDVDKILVPMKDE